MIITKNFVFTKGEKIVDVIPVQRSQSSASKKSSRMSNFPIMSIPHKSMIKGTRVVDPKLRIRPFKSRVTFSDDTKKGDIQEIEKLVYFIPKPQTGENSSSELSELSMLDVHPDQMRASLTESRLYPTTHLMVEIPPESLAEKKAEMLLRRQSLDPTLIESVCSSKNCPHEHEKWLHHQSLPNIQEGQEGDDSNLIAEALQAQAAPAIIKQMSVKRQTSDRTSERRKSFKRQTSSHEAEEEYEPTEEEVVAAIIEDKLRDITAGRPKEIQPPSAPPDAEPPKFDVPFKKRLKDNPSVKPRQSSTESDTASYHTANSFLMQISEDREDLPELINTSTSSMDSYTSALGDDQKNGNHSPEVILPKITFTEPSPSTSSLATENGSPDHRQQSKFFGPSSSPDRRKSLQDLTTTDKT